MTRSIPGRLHGLQLDLQRHLERQADELAELADSRIRAGGTGLTRRSASELMAATRQALAETTAALKRMGDGTYGVCQRCGQNIPLEQLEASPATRYCLACRRARR